MSISTSQKAGFSGTGVNVAIATEAVFATPAAPTTYLDVTTHNLSITNNLLANMVMRKSVGQVPPGIGSVSGKGDITSNVTVDSIGPILVAGMGLDTVTASGGGFIHNFTMQNPLNSYSIATQDSSTFLGVGTFVGSKCDKLNISCKPDGFLEIKSSWMTQTLTYSASSTLSPVYSTANFFEFAHLGSIYGGLGSSVLNSVPFDCVDFTLDLANNLHDRKGSTGGRFSIAFGETVRKVTGSFTVEMDSVSLNTYNQLLWGTPNGPSPGLLARVPLAFTFTQSGSAYNPSITFKVGALTVSSATITRSKNNVLTQSVQFEVSESVAGASDDLGIVLTNSSATAYS
jgi:hypothetical protein